MSEKVKIGLGVGLFVIIIVVAFAVYIPWQTNRMNRDQVRDAMERSPQNLERLYEQWQALVKYGDLQKADALASEIADLYGDNSILIPADGGHFIVDGSKI